MIEVRLKNPRMHVFIKGDLKKKSMKQSVGELFMKPDINILMAEKNGGKTIAIPASNIAFMQEAEEE